jgi:hypothetical protein
MLAFLLVLVHGQPNEAIRKTIGEQVAERRRQSVGDVVEWYDPSVRGKIVGVVPTGTDGREGLVWHRRNSWNPFSSGWNVRVMMPNPGDADYTMRSAYDADHYYAKPPPEGYQGTPAFLRPFTKEYWKMPERDPQKPEYWNVVEPTLPPGDKLPGTPRANVVPLQWRPELDANAEEPLAGADLRKFLGVHFAPKKRGPFYDSRLTRNPTR